MFAIGQCAGHFHRYWHRSEQPIQKKCLRVAAKHLCVGGTGRAHAYGDDTRTAMWQLSHFCEIYGSDCSGYEDYCLSGCDII